MMKSVIWQSRLGENQERNLIEKEVAHKIFEKYRKPIIEQVGGKVYTSSHLSRVKSLPKTDENYPIAKMDTNGDLIKNKIDYAL